LEAGVLLLEFPHSGVYEFPLTGVINDATSALKFSDLDPALQEQMWELAQRFAIERSTEDGRASERLRRSSDPTRIGGGE
jgi:hypothetical protein